MCWAPADIAVAVVFAVVLAVALAFALGFAVVTNYADSCSKR